MMWRKEEGGKVTNLNYSTEQVPDNMIYSEFLIIPKKNGAVECSKNRKISIMRKVANVVLKVME